LDQPESVNDHTARERIAAERPDAVLICAFGALIEEPLLSAHPMLNVHPSLLPRWRGAAPVERAIEAGDAETGVSIMKPIAEMDAGPVFLQERERIRPDDDYGSLAPRLAAVGGELLVRALDESPPPHDQPGDGVTEAPKIGAEDRRLDPAMDAEALARRVGALNPHIGTWIPLEGEERLGVAAATPAPRGPAPGALASEDGRLLFGCAGGALELLRVKPPGGREMEAADWARGHKESLQP
ncbi:MAG: methionyl-tRNA formyltransferase, partial [Thermoleophilaceae bacterium]|nr:methionyl-tRNA formyltransferase [Thermoleophilaceae bacterium]